MSLSRPFQRPRAIFAGLAIVVCAVAGYLTLRAVGFIPVAQRSERLGPFEITYTTYDAYGHRGTGRTLHYHASDRRVLVSRELGTFELDPNNPTGVLFEHCSNGERPECGIRYFDGRNKRNWKVSNEQVIHQPVGQPVSWSADGRYVVLAGEFHAHIVNLENASTIDVSDVLALREEPGGRSVELGEWSPDARKMIVLVNQYSDPVPPFVNVAQDLIVLDVQDGLATYVATARSRAWTSVGYTWRLTPNGYAVLAAVEDRGIGWTTYRKPSSDLPAGMLPQWP